MGGAVERMPVGAPPPDDEPADAPAEALADAEGDGEGVGGVLSADFATH